MPLGERMKIARESIGKGQKEMAQLCGASYRMWQAYEVGENQPKAEVIEALVKLGFNANWLLTGEGDIRRGSAEYPLAETLKNGDMLSDTVQVVPATALPKINGAEFIKAEDQPFGWFHEWIVEELKGKSITEIMRFAVKIKAELDKERDG